MVTCLLRKLSEFANNHWVGPMQIVREALGSHHKTTPGTFRLMKKALIAHYDEDPVHKQSAATKLAGLHWNPETTHIKELKTLVHNLLKIQNGERTPTTKEIVEKMHDIILRSQCKGYNHITEYIQYMAGHWSLLPPDELLQRMIIHYEGLRTAHHIKVLEHSNEYSEKRQHKQQSFKRC